MKIISLGLLLILAVSCRTASEVSAVSILEEEGYAPDPQRSFVEVKDLKANGQELELTAVFKGCSDDHQFELVYDPFSSGADSLRFFLLHDSKDRCFSIMEKTLKFQFEAGVGKACTLIINQDRFSICKP